jgi:PBP1b-binding outer membrane lipoprotein LpoB
MKKAMSILMIVAAVLAVNFLAGCATTTSGYRPDPSIPVENLATLTIANQSIHITAIDGVETTVNYPKAIKIQSGKHTIACYHQQTREIMTKMSRNLGGNTSYLTKIEFEFLGNRSYELYDASKTKTTGTLRTTEYDVAIREAIR